MFTFFFTLHLFLHIFLQLKINCKFHNGTTIWEKWLMPERPQRAIALYKRQQGKGSLRGWQWPMSSTAPSGWTLSPFHLVFLTFLSPQSISSACTHRSSKPDPKVHVLHSPIVVRLYIKKVAERLLLKKKKTKNPGFIYLFSGFWDTARICVDCKTGGNEELGFDNISQNSSCKNRDQYYKYIQLL